MNKKFYFLFFLFAFIFPPAVKAYAGPGVAIGAIIVFLTVIMAFFASTFITVFNFVKGVIGKIFKNQKTDIRNDAVKKMKSKKSNN